MKRRKFVGVNALTYDLRESKTQCDSTLGTLTVMPPHLITETDNDIHKGFP